MKKLTSLFLAIVMILTVATFAVSAKEYTQPFTQYGEAYENIVEGSKTYRIPALYTLNNGAVLAVADKRYAHGSDSPNNIDVLAAISANGYTDWQYNCINYLEDYPDDKTATDAASFIDSAVAQSSTGRIFVISDACPSGGGYWQALNGTGFYDMYLSETEVHRGLLLTNGNYAGDLADFQYCVGPFVDGFAVIYKKGTADAQGNAQKYNNGKWMWFPTEYSINGEFELYKNGEALTMKQIGTDKVIAQNIFYKDAEFTCYLTTYLMMRYSDDNGATWSAPILISSQVKKDNEGFLGIGPGRGLVTNYNGKERIIFAVYDNAGAGVTPELDENVSTIYSDDNGVTWHRGAETACRSFMTKTSEAQIVELGNGTLRMFSRNKGRYVAYADSTDGGHSWTKFRSDLELPSNGNCMFSFINAEVDGKKFVLGSYASSKNARNNGVIKVGVVEGNDINWVNTYNVKTGFYAYSCLTQLKDGNIGLLYEGKADEITYMILTLDKDGKLSEINGNNYEGEMVLPSGEGSLRAFFGFFDKILSFLGLI